jgi:hypothetical protein
MPITPKRGSFLHAESQLMGRSLSDGFSHVIATRAQICSGVNVAGAPERCTSASCSGTDCLSGA